MYLCHVTWNYQQITTLRYVVRLVSRYRAVDVNAQPLCVPFAKEGIALSST